MYAIYLINKRKDDCQGYFSKLVDNRNKSTDAYLGETEVKPVLTHKPERTWLRLSRALKTVDSLEEKLTLDTEKYSYSGQIKKMLVYEIRVYDMYNYRVVKKINAYQNEGSKVKNL